jgi:hypothetical protein
MSTVPPSDRPQGSYGGAPPAPGWHGPAAAPGWTDPSVQPPPVAAGRSGAWSPPGTGYREPVPADPAYQATTAWPAGRGAEAGYRAPRARRAGSSWLAVAPALFASVALSVGVAVLFLGNLFVALGAPSGTSGRDRLLQFLTPADLATVVALALAVALVVLQRHMPVDNPVVGPRGGRVRSVALLAGVVAAFVTVAAMLRAIVFLTVPHQTGAVKVGDFVAELAIVLIAAAVAAWALRQRW